MTISDTFVDIRLVRIDGRDFCDHLFFRYRVTPERPAQATLLGPDIPRLQQYMKALRVPYEMKVDARNDFGDTTRATFIVTGSLPCEATIRADYDNGKVIAELTNVRRAGRLSTRFDAKVLDEVTDDFARYVLGADDDFEKLFAR